MTPEFFSQLADKSISIAILAIGGWFIMKYFMNQINTERSQNQANLLQFVSLIKESNQVHMQTTAAMTNQSGLINSVSTRVEDLHRKLEEGRFCKAKS